MKIVGLVIAGLVVVGFVIVSRNSNGALVKPLDKVAESAPDGDEIGLAIEVDQLKKEYGEFAELTIPFLRSRIYQGSKIEVKQNHGQSNTYSSMLVSYDSDGLSINGILTRPNGQAPASGFPAVVFLHGYIQPDLYVSTERYNDYVNYLARNGLVVFKIDLRGHGESQGEPGGAYFSSDYVIDTLNAYESLKRLDYVDSERIGLWGHSMAGNIVLRSMAVRPEISAGVIWAGAVYSYVDFVKYGISDNSFVRSRDIPNRFLQRSRNLFEAVGEVSATSEFWRQVAATSYLGDFEGRVQLHHASNDAVVNVGYSKDLAKLLGENGLNYEIYLYDSGGHNLSSPAFEVAMRRTVGFYGD